MTQIQIKHADGHTDLREVSRSEPLMVGRGSTCDIRTDATGVQPIHARIARTRRGVEVTATSPAGVVVNGAVTTSALLVEGTVVEVGDLEFRLFTGKESVRDEDEVRLAPIQEDESEKGIAEVAVRDLRSPFPASRRAAFRSPRATDDADENERERVAAPGASRRGSPVAVSDASLEVFDDPKTERLVGVRDHKDDDKGDHKRDDLREARRSEPARRALRQRPDEPLRSPLVIGLTVGVLALLLVSGTIWFWMQRETIRRRFATAVSAFESGSYSDATGQFQKFLADYPTNAFAPDARMYLAKARVEQPFSGSAPLWEETFQAVDRFARQYQDEPDFADADSPARRYLVDICTRMTQQAAKMASAGGGRPLLTRAVEARNLLDNFAPRDPAPTELLSDMDAVIRSAEAAVKKQEALRISLKVLDTALAQSQTLAALDEYTSLLARYPEFATERSLLDRLQRTLKYEQSGSQRIEDPPAATIASDSKPVSLAPYSLVRRTSSRSDLSSGAGVVFAVSGGTCFAVNTDNGQPLWRRFLGEHLAFFPLPVSARVPAVLLFDARRQSLDLLDRHTGVELWSAALGDRCIGTPLQLEGQLYASTASGSVFQIDVATGRIGVRLKLLQPLSGAPVADATGERLFVPAHSRVGYVLTRRPLDVEKVQNWGHGPGSISAPLIRAGSYLLFVENDQPGSCRIRAFDLVDPAKGPVELVSLRMDGNVHEPLIIRGKLVLAANGRERLTAFTLSDTHDAQALSQRTNIQPTRPRSPTTYISAGPDDQVWVAGSTLRRYQLLDNTARLQKPEIPIGIAAQPVQTQGDLVYVGRNLTYGPGVMLLEADRQQMVGRWQTALGPRLASTSLNLNATLTEANAGPFACVTTLGDVFSVDPSVVGRGGFHVQSESALPIPDSVEQPLVAGALPDGRIAVACGGSEPRLWMLTQQGSRLLDMPLPAPLECAPTALGDGLLLPVSGRLLLVDPRARKPVAEPFLAPVKQGEPPPSWISLIPLTADRALAVNSTGRIIVVERRAGETPHLAEVAQWAAAGTLAVPPTELAGRLFVVDADGQLDWLDSATFEPQGSIRLPAAAAVPVQAAGSWAFVSLGTGQTEVLSLGAELKPLPSIELSGELLVGALAMNDSTAILATQSGSIVKASPDSGRILARWTTPMLLTGGPWKVRGRILVAGADGSLLDVTPDLEGSP
jgi:TolA-binding protein